MIVARRLRMLIVAEGALQGLTDKMKDVKTLIISAAFENAGNDFVQIQKKTETTLGAKGSLCCCVLVTTIVWRKHHIHHASVYIPPSPRSLSLSDARENTTLHRVHCRPKNGDHRES